MKSKFSKISIFDILLLKDYQRDIGENSFIILKILK